MGSAGAGAYHFNAQFKNTLGWLPDSAVHNVLSNGVYRIYAFDSPNRVDGRFYAAHVTKDYRRDYWIEFRQRFTSNPWAQNGVLLNWSPWESSSGGTHLLDTTPGTPTSNSSREDAAVVIGRTFTDPGAGVHITPIARGSSWNCHLRQRVAGNDDGGCGAARFAVRGCARRRHAAAKQRRGCRNNSIAWGTLRAWTDFIE